MSLVILLLLLAALMLPILMTNRRQKQHHQQILQMQASITPGMRVLTAAGLHATVRQIRGDILLLSIAPGVEVEWERAYILKVVDQDPTVTVPEELDADEIVDDVPAQDGLQLDESAELPEETEPKDRPEDR